MIDPRKFPIECLFACFLASPTDSHAPSYLHISGRKKPIPHNLLKLASNAQLSPFRLMYIYVYIRYMPMFVYLPTFLDTFFSSICSRSFFLWKWGATSFSHCGRMGMQLRMYSLFVSTSS